MKLDDFLKVKKVKLVGPSGLHLTKGKHYTVLGVTDISCIVNDDNECEAWADMKYFEPVLDSVENPLQGMELTPEFEALEPKFKMGDKVYKYGEADVKTVLEVFEGGYMRISDYPYRVNHETLCHATPENHALLSKPFPAIEFEQPPKELKGSDLTRALIKKGWCGFNCMCGNSGDDNVLINTIITGKNHSGQFIGIDGRLYNNAVAMFGSYPLTAEQVGL